MTEQAKPSFEVVAPVFAATDIARSRRYYTDQLGFEVGFEWADEEGAPPRYLVLVHGKTELHLSQDEQPRPSIAYFFLDGVQEYYQAVRGRQADITEPLTDYPWEMREFAAQDPDGNKLIFGEHLSRLKPEAGGGAAA